MDDLLLLVRGLQDPSDKIVENLQKILQLLKNSEECVYLLKNWNLMHNFISLIENHIEEEEIVDLSSQIISYFCGDSGT
jgi:hypothetical protein